MEAESKILRLNHLWAQQSLTSSSTSMKVQQICQLKDSLVAWRVWVESHWPYGGREYDWTTYRSLPNDLWPPRLLQWHPANLPITHQEALIIQPPSPQSNGGIHEVSSNESHIFPHIMKLIVIRSPRMSLIFPHIMKLIAQLNWFLYLSASLLRCWSLSKLTGGYGIMYVCGLWTLNAGLTSVQI